MYGELPRTSDPKRLQEMPETYTVYRSSTSLQNVDGGSRYLKHRTSDDSSQALFSTAIRAVPQRKT